MNYIGILITCLLSIHGTTGFSEELVKRLTQPKPGGILDALKKPKIPGLNFQVGGSKSFGAQVGIGSFSFGFGFGGQYVPPGKGINLPPPNEPNFPDVDSHLPGTPDLKPQVPGVKPPYVPGVKPQYPWENEDKPRPNWEDYGEDDKKHGSYEKDKVDKPKLNPYEESKEDSFPDWEDIGEKKDDEDFEKKSEDFNNGDLTGQGFIQPRRNRYRGRRFVESHVYHVPLLFRSNAKPFQVRVHSNPNTLTKDGSEK